MDYNTELERRIQVLEDIEAIKRLKAKYWHCVDGKDWDGLGDCLAEDFVFDNPHLGVMEGRDYVVKVLKKIMKDVTTSHQGHTPEIDIISEAVAVGRWALNDRVETPDKGFFSGRGIYQEEYIKVDGRWKISRSKLTYALRDSST